MPCRRRFRPCSTGRLSRAAWVLLALPVLTASHCSVLLTTRLAGTYRSLVCVLFPACWRCIRICPSLRLPLSGRSLSAGWTSFVLSALPALDRIPSASSFPQIPTWHRGCLPNKDDHQDAHPTGTPDKTTSIGQRDGSGVDTWPDLANAAVLNRRPPTGWTRRQSAASHAAARDRDGA